MTKHETCVEYFRRRLSEGWKCISLKEYSAVLLSPEGMLRELDLRNDVETLRPNAAGSEKSITSPGGTHWNLVDEAIPDGDATAVYTIYWPYERDLYNLPASSGSGTINNIKIHVRCRAGDNGYPTFYIAKPSLKSNGTVTDGTEIQLPSIVYVTYSQTWATNPADAGAWSWTDIDALQIGVSLADGAGFAYGTWCTQVYVEVDYTPAAAGGSEGKTAAMAAKCIAGKLI